MTRICSLTHAAVEAWIPEAWTRWTFEGDLFRRAANGISIEVRRGDRWLPVLDRASGYCLASPFEAVAR